MAKRIFSVSFLLVLLNVLHICIKFSVADLPTHVETKNLLGKWKILRTKTSPNLTTCGSSQPNKNTYNVGITDYKKYLLENNYEFVSELNVILSDDYVLYGDIYNTQDNEHRSKWKVLAVYDENKRVIGTWTTICDEGFEIKIGNETYAALMHYEPNGKCGPVSDEDSLDSNGDTDCYTTSFSKIRYGWLDVENEKNEHLHGCFYAERIFDNVNEIKHLDSFTIDKDSQNVLQTFTYDTKLNNILNSNNMLYKFGNLQKPTFTKRNNTNVQFNSELNWHRMKHHGKKKPLKKSMLDASRQTYACPCNANEVVDNVINKGDSDNPVSPTLIQLNNNLKNTTQTGNKDTNEMDLENYEDTLNSPKRELEINELPKNFTWGDPWNKNTREYEVTNQLLCGSCYIASQLYAFKRRIEVALTKKLDRKYLNNFDDQLSIQTVLSCSFYDQGCNGGFPYLVSKLAKLQGIPLNVYFPYSATEETCPYNISKHPNDMNGSAKLREINAIFNSNNNMSTYNNINNDHHQLGVYANTASSQEQHGISEENRWYAKDFNYVGGCYGCNQCNGEKIMMNEIYRNGPIVSSFEASPDFYDYADGVYFVEDFPHARRCTIEPKNDGVYNITGWDRVNHAIVLLGWGEEEINGKLYKYWIGRNSWGNGWGKEGYFKILRGQNFSGIESQSLFIEPDFSRGAGKILLEKMQKELGN
ncbi:hypothetical protein PFAG_03258 [Plasmodium falciparum Santa Lucia]|uniref:Dipeptidyl aminopeptidase 1 n=7 Tax=Plasmodium falciparum TaxID=5833 RepID=DPAP1_PLAF7|nr:dipeptidyl aminopeptidase 1 [Plasmodium falciparum 3D7]Q8IIJ9.1 RecName: Full=Dipeptidyl aminopeptidase 1; AltName: Full=Cathepsin C homolog; Contains: RecName: Full=Dipeptidyl aminopeptidase 1 exclusion domain chain; Contains: RecName: Full=Dipeptidyl aminopeptidase 1 heavy chain; Contains: RecName: Full=Dipeptidyl aminopeptidase 1 light chain; Flags: Precursor [Plasmodium falciparum 3D7]ETW30436.1 hypothetical protein PFFCH_02130 [Plasmodium falciparum FCH/4]ETW52794.1 hypothetical protein |eukprot:XP_001347845.1 dipeptidyl aminopeptidase 1 [Plasmodium falciparum 3D7]